MTKILLIDIAKKAGVSVGTVDRVIHNRGKVSKNTEGKVLAAIEELNYRPNLVARGLARQKKYRIAVLMPSSKKDPFWELPLSGIQNAYSLIRDFGFEIHLFTYNEDHRSSFLEKGFSIKKSEFQGVLVAPLLLEESINLFNHWETEEIPYVQINTHIDRTEDDNFLSYVGQDSYSSGVLAGRLLSFGNDTAKNLLILHLENEIYNQHHLIQKEKGFVAFLKRNNSENLIKRAVYTEFQAQQKKQNAFFKDLIRDINGVFITTSKAYKVMQYITKNANPNMRTVGFDLIPSNTAMLENGQIDFLINQNPIRQGYIGLMSLFKYLLQGKKPDLLQMLPLDVVMKENLLYYQKDYEQLASVFS